MAIRLWTHDIRGMSAPIASWNALLDTDEREKAARFVRSADRVAYTAGHALLRAAIGRFTGFPPESLRFSRDGNGKPFLEHPATGFLHFNLSHTGGMVAVVLGTACPVGVDVELLGSLPGTGEELVAYGLSPEEILELSVMGEEVRRRAFFRLWTIREAVAKADGRGLSISLPEILVERGGASACLADAGGTMRRWRLWSSTPSVEHQLTVAWPSDADVELVPGEPLF